MANSVTGWFEMSLRFRLPAITSLAEAGVRLGQTENVIGELPPANLP